MTARYSRPEGWAASAGWSGPGDERCPSGACGADGEQGHGHHGALDGALGVVGGR